MDTDRVGPLSYSLEPTAGEFSAERPILIASAATVGAAVPIAVLGWLSHDVIASRRLVLWLGALAVWLVALGVAWLLSPGTRRRRRNALLGVSITALFVSLAVFLVLDISRPSIVQLRHSLSGVEIPDDWRLVSDTAEGNRRCLPDCPRVELIYDLPPGTANPVRDVVRVLLTNGWSQKDQNVPPDAATAAVRDRVLADVYSAFGESRVRIVLSTNDSRVPAG